MRQITALCGLLILSLTATSTAWAQKTPKFAPPGSLAPPPEVIEQIRAKTAVLAEKIAELRKDAKHHALLPDVEVYLRGGENIVRFREFFHKDSGKWTLDALDRGLERADDLAKGRSPWTNAIGQNVARGYRSSVDDTAQPYGVTYPLNYGKDAAKSWRVDVVLHGRNSSLTEVSFLNTHNGKRKAASDQDYVQIDIYGRGNNAYRWSGETDVLEALEAFFAGEHAAGRGRLPDRRRVVLRGFSMGGAGTWHLGLHYPDKWCVMGPGAGFTTTHGYAGGLPNPLPDYQEKCLRIYDAIDYTENARMIPIVAYSGANDAQKLAADNIEKRLAELKIDSMTHLVAPGVEHQFPPAWFKKANMLWSAHADKGRPEQPKKVSFITYSTKFHHCDWIAIRGLEKHYVRAEVEAELAEGAIRVTSKNVHQLQLDLQGQIKTIYIDNSEIGEVGTGPITLSKKGSKWMALKNDQGSTPRKQPGLQGPIDDAFTSGFVCVIGSGETWHPATKKHLDAKLAAFRHDWAKHWRGELPTTGDYAVTPNDIKDKHLVLFGDPNSNLTLAQVLPKLPLKWTKDEIEFGGKKYASGEHLPVLIFPNPLNPKKYVVLNTGHTIPSGDYARTNALLFPRLGDYAVLRISATGKDAAAHEVATAGLFNEQWEIEGN